MTSNKWPDKIPADMMKQALLNAGRLISLIEWDDRKAAHEQRVRELKGGNDGDGPTEK
jgi:hypothetical protein